MVDIKASAGIRVGAGGIVAKAAYQIGAMFIPGREELPLMKFRFEVEIDGVIAGSFSEVSGLDIEIETEEIKEGGVNDFVHKFPKQTKYSNIVLKKGVALTDVLFDWVGKTAHGTIERTNIYISLLDSQFESQHQWVVENAYPVKWTGPDLKADDSSVAIESVEIVHGGIKKV